MTLVVVAAAVVYAAVFGVTVWALRRRDRLYAPDADADNDGGSTDAPHEPSNTRLLGGDGAVGARYGGGPTGASAARVC